MKEYNPVLIGDIYGRWKVIGKGKNDIWNSPTWICECQCGKIKPVNDSSLKSGKSLSCGCFHHEVVSLLLKNRNKKYNKYDLSGDFGIGFDSKGREFYFDIEDYDKIKDICWRVKRGRRDEPRKVVGKDVRTGVDVLLHHYILNIPVSKNIEIDHKDRNPLNNMRYNLRVATRSQNSANKTLLLNNTSGVTGVSRAKRKEYPNYNKWSSRIESNGTSHHLGTFETFGEAVIARLLAEKEYFGEFAPQRHLFSQYGIE